MPDAAGDGENVNLVIKMVQAVNDRDLGALDEVVSADIVRHSAATPDVSISSLDEFKAFLEQDLTTCPDVHLTVERAFGSGDMAAVLMRYAGTQHGPMGPFPATGRRVEMPFISILRIDAGKIAEMWVEWDNLNMLVQLGHLTPPGSGEPS